jgi:hypothetical protein
LPGYESNHLKCRYLYIATVIDGLCVETEGWISKIVWRVISHRQKIFL